jgi:hypothetical protein
MSGAGALGFRDFPGLLAAKENRTGSRQTLLPILLCGAAIVSNRAGGLTSEVTGMRSRS